MTTNRRSFFGIIAGLFVGGAVAKSLLVEQVRELRTDSNRLYRSEFFKRRIKEIEDIGIERDLVIILESAGSFTCDLDLE